MQRICIWILGLKGYVKHCCILLLYIMPREKVFTTSVKAMFELEIRESVLSRLHSPFKLQEPGLTCTCISRLVTEWGRMGL